MGNEDDQASEENAEGNEGDSMKEARDRRTLERRKEDGCERRQDSLFINCGNVRQNAPNPVHKIEMNRVTNVTRMIAKDPVAIFRGRLGYDFVGQIQYPKAADSSNGK